MVNVKVRHMHRIKGRWYWIPSKTARALGFASEPLGDDIRAATARAEKLNAQLDAERERKAPAKIAQGTVAALIKRYIASPAFADLSASTQKGYRQILARIESKAGDVDVTGITRSDVVETYEQLRERHGEASAAAMMRVWRLLLGFSYDIGWRNDNPAKGLRLRTLAPRRRVWSPEEVRAFIAAAQAEGRDSMALAVELAYDTGQRQADILKLTWTQYDGTAFTLRQSKTSAPVIAVVSPEMQARLSTVERRGVQLVVSEATAKPYKKDHFAHEFARLREVAGLPKDLQFRDLRRTAATELGQAGATDDQIRAQTGHKSRNVVAVYVVPERTMSEAAQTKRQALKKKQGGNGESKP